MLLVNARGVPEMPIQDAVLRIRVIEEMEILMDTKKDKCCIDRVH